MAKKMVGLAAAAIGTAAVIGLGGYALAEASTSTISTNTPSASTSEGNDDSSIDDGTGSMPDRERGGSTDTPVTGDELAKVTAAVEADDSSITVTSVRKDPDGSYDVFATKAGTPIMLEVSADLTTITEGMGGGPGVEGMGGGPGEGMGPGGHRGGHGMSEGAQGGGSATPDGSQSDGGRSGTDSSDDDA